jgi:mRNA-degrading endonuclease RelE of RelBE toxin-antitoxin system
MGYEVIATPHFKKEFKRLFKKYPSLREDIDKLGEQLQENPQLGTEVFKNCYKIRFAIRSKGTGKRGGGRLITHVKIVDKCVFLMTIYDKSEISTITDSDLKQLLQDLK